VSIVLPYSPIVWLSIHMRGEESIMSPMSYFTKSRMNQTPSRRVKSRLIRANFSLISSYLKAKNVPKCHLKSTRIGEIEAKKPQNKRKKLMYCRTGFNLWAFYDCGN
jgi:hypothetical protein